MVDMFPYTGWGKIELRDKSRDVILAFFILGGEINKNIVVL